MELARCEKVGSALHYMTASTVGQLHSGATKPRDQANHIY